MTSTRLPPEMVRKGRFDEIFFVDLPSTQNRRDILGIHLGERGLDPAGFDLDALATAAAGFSGSEIEQAIVSAMYAAPARTGRRFFPADLLAEIQQTKPFCVVMAEKVYGNPQLRPRAGRYPVINRLRANFGLWTFGFGL